ncbi:hypothetical protein H8R17_31460 [Streptomyces sp. TRM68367]|nr:hypothetical protein [Streptomyces sp. TRM68367]
MLGTEGSPQEEETRMSTFAVPPVPAARTHRRRRNRTILLISVGITAFAVLVYAMIRPDSAQAMGEDLLYDVSENGEVVAFFDEFRGLEVQMDLAEPNQPTGTATGEEVQAAVDEMKATVQKVLGWDMDTQEAAMQAEATRFGELMGTHRVVL